MRKDEFPIVDKLVQDSINEVLDKIRAEIKEKIEQEYFTRSEQEYFARFAFRRGKKDIARSNQCTGSIIAYDNVIKLIDKYKAESEE